MIIGFSKQDYLTHAQKVSCFRYISDDFVRENFVNVWLLLVCVSWSFESISPNATPNKHKNHLSTTYIGKVIKVFNISLRSCNFHTILLEIFDEHISHRQKTSNRGEVLKTNSNPCILWINTRNIPNRAKQLACKVSLQISYNNFKIITPLFRHSFSRYTLRCLTLETYSIDAWNISVKFLLNF